MSASPQGESPLKHVVIGIDPSSTRTGFAEFDVVGVRLLDAGYFSPPAKAAAWERIVAMVNDMFDFLEDVDAERIDIVVESTSGKVAKRHRGGGAGLAVYGMAVGAFLMALIEGALQQGGRLRVHHVAENVWTRGVPKRKRRALIRARYPQYAAATAGRTKDAGGDVSDAIEICEWAIENLLSGGPPRP